MCGIAGFIGRSKNPAASYKLISALFYFSDIRGIDAAGYFGTTIDGDVLYHKQPGKSGDIIDKDIWLKFAKTPMDMLICHARGASSGVGGPSTNKNNHPFVSETKSLGVVHNGRVNQTDYDLFVKKYNVTSKCDSEIFLRVFEAASGDKAELEKMFEKADHEYLINLGMTDREVRRLLGLRDIWSFFGHTDKNSMAVAIAERVSEDERQLWLLRNQGRPLWVADLREQLGQVFFCSTYEIFEKAFQGICGDELIGGKVRTTYLHPDEMWSLKINKDAPHVDIENVMKITVKSSAKTTWKPEGASIPIYQNNNMNLKVISILGADDEITNKSEIENNTLVILPDPEPAPVAASAVNADDDETIDLTASTTVVLEQSCSTTTIPAAKKNMAKHTAFAEKEVFNLIATCKTILSEIEINFDNKIIEGMDMTDMNRLIADLEDIQGRLESAKPA